MLQCEYCLREAAPLARTATRVWIGCPYCHRTWNVNADNCPAVLTAEARETEVGGTSPLRGQVIGVLAVAVALAVRMLLRPALGTASPFLLFTPAVAIAAIYGGLAPGVIATVLGAGFGSHFFLPATAEPMIEYWDRIILFTIVGAVITVSTTLLRQSRHQLAASLWREQKARAKAEAADRAKDDFLAMVSHELQTPLSVVLGWTSLIRRQPMTGEALDHALDAVDRNTDMLRRLVDDVLDRSRIATGTLRLDAQFLSVKAVARAATDQMHTRFEAAGLWFDYSVTGDPFVVGDSIRLQQVLVNLLTNALKFTPRGGRVSLTVTETHDSAQIGVIDTGAGISADLLPHVFEAFRQGSETQAQSSRGLGLGLAISRYLVERHRGTITAASAGSGRGATFTVTLPLVHPPFQTNPALKGFTEHRPSTSTLH